jgi:hypothetical protein
MPDGGLSDTGPLSTGTPRPSGSCPRCGDSLESRGQLDAGHKGWRHFLGDLIAPLLARDVTLTRQNDAMLQLDQCLGCQTAFLSFRDR